MDLNTLALNAKLNSPGAHADLLDALMPRLIPAAARRWPGADRGDVALAVASGVAKGVELWDGAAPAAEVLSYHAMRAVELAAVTTAAE